MNYSVITRRGFGMCLRMLAFAGGVTGAITGANAQVNWTDWISGKAGPSGSAMGALSIGSATVTVSVHPRVCGE